VDANGVLFFPTPGVFLEWEWDVASSAVGLVDDVLFMFDEEI
jgi:hypothetical protein